jgi:putative tricarboxylic transport membrane protein
VEALSSLIAGFGVLGDPMNIMYMFIGISLGVLIGVLPGLGGANGVAILLPLTFSMSPTSAIIMLSCIYWGALFGGAITSILFNIPGEPWSVATTFDGYPLARQGRAGEPPSPPPFSVRCSPSSSSRSWRRWLLRSR